MACSSSLLMFKLENVESRNPLECLICDREFLSPVRLPCQHNYCRECIQNRKTCPVCGTAIDGEAYPDNLLSFLIDTSHETADICANCDQISQPMHFCETCQQALCNRCRNSTHQARMFAAHRVVPLEERARVKGRMTCPTHGEPYILYSMESRNLACIVCFNNAAFDSRHHLVQIDAAHKMGCEKLDKATVKLRAFQDDVSEQLQLRKRLASELAESYRVACESIRQTCQEMTDMLLTVRDRLLKKLDEEMATRIQHFREQMRQLISLQPTTRLCLLSASIFCSSASKLDFLQFYTDLLKRIQSLISIQCEKPQYTGELIVNSREEFNRALEPFLGLSSFLLCTNVNSDSDGNERSCGTASPKNNFVRRSGSTVVNGCQLLLKKYQLVVDLAGAFGEQFSRVEIPLQHYNHEMTKLGKRCMDLDIRVGQHSAVVSDLQPQLQQIWQEELDRVRRQQIEEIITLQEKARHIVSAAKQLKPYVVCLAAVTSIIDYKRCHKPDLAPMETICRQINTLEPDSQQRIEAIEKSKKINEKSNDDNFRSSRPPLVNTNRDRSRGGTDRALLSPCQRRHKRDWLNSSKSQCNAHEVESSLDISFEFFARCPTAEVEFTKVECEDILILSNSSLWNDSHISKQITDADLCRTHCEERNEISGSKIPEVPFVPKTIFANLNTVSTTRGTYEMREKVLESLKQRVSIFDAYARFKTTEYDT
ncbi:hypothetical protein DINM_022820 [Dirofilaria immitis]|nr:hypothetical protein [Dirofilaria immitis]